MPRLYWTSGAAGLAAALIYSLAAFVGPLSVLTGVFSPLPIMLAGLSSGVMAAALATAVAGAATSLLLNVPVGLGFAMFIGAPATFLCHLALLNRSLTSQTGKTFVEWYPIGRLLVWLSSFGAALFLIWAVTSFGQEGGLPGQSRAAILEAVGGQEGWSQFVNDFTADFDETGPSAQQLEDIMTYMAAIFPAAMAISFALLLALNGGLAQIALSRRALALRPNLKFSALSLPKELDIAFALCLGLALMPGDLGYMGKCLAAIFAAPYFLLGLAVVHVISTALSGRTLLLVMFYMALLFFPGLAVVVILLGIAEQLFGVRSRAGMPAADNSD